jgi:hypothetical protein
MMRGVRTFVRRASWGFVVAGLILGVGTSARANTINFDSLSNGDVVTNQFAGQGITFSSAGGEVIRVTTQAAYQSTSPNFICTSPAGGSIDCTGTVIFNFATPVNGLEFDALGNSNAIGTSFAQADIYQNGILTVSNLNLLVSLGNFQPDHQNLSAYNNITEVLIHNNTDPAGTGYDTISFNPTNASAVPEPATLTLVGLSLAGLGVARRRKKV